MRIFRNGRVAKLNLFCFLFQEARYGFPSKPTALAWDSELQLLAIATRSGTLRM
jgi:hypothetical protein